MGNMGLRLLESTQIDNFMESSVKSRSNQGIHPGTHPDIVNISLLLYLGHLSQQNTGSTDQETSGLYP